MPNILIYSSEHCPYCVRAKELLQRKGCTYQEVRIDLDPQAKETMMAITGRRTVPQIFINDQHIGGCDDLYALEKAGGLDKLLS